jgi:hypothetical protein
MQIFLENLLWQGRHYGIDSELIIVEWNPPQNNKRLKDVLKWPSQARHCRVRVIEVSPEIHHGFKNSDVIPLFQMIAKNVGVRRAGGRFVLATNIDILFSNELMEFFASKALDPTRMYRIDRHDVPFEFSQDMSVDERLEWCRQHVLRLYRYLETVEVIGGLIPEPKNSRFSMPTDVMNWLLQREKPLHTNACGDFTLLSNEYWEKVGGYPEFPLRAMKLDGLLCYAAHYAGAREYILKDPMRIYHLEHAPRADGADIALSKRDSESSNLQISLSQYQTWVTQMRNSHRPIIFNGYRWGLADQKLPETVIC